MARCLAPDMAGAGAAARDATARAARSVYRAHAVTIEPLELLWEDDALPAFDLPEELERLYGGSFGLEEPLVYANFVETIDGVVAIPSLPNPNRLVAGER